METLNEINERHEAVKELNKSLLELHQMFLDMAVLVEQQGVQLDNIERQVSPFSQCLCSRNGSMNGRHCWIRCQCSYAGG
jgi:t-SNARE complex subunit (syntaxin)